MIPRVGKSAGDIPIETQMLLLEVCKDQSSLEEPTGNNGYIVFLPFLDGEMRSSLQGNSADELQVCVETGQVFLLFTKKIHLYKSSDDFQLHSTNYLTCITNGIYNC